MKNNPLNSLATAEEKKIYEKIRFFSLFYPFKQKKLNRIGNEVKKILAGFNVTYPIIFDFKNPQEFSRYAVAHIDSTKWTNYKIYIHYNPRFINLEFEKLVYTGLHEYCHIIYRQKEDFSNRELQQLFLNIDHNRFIESVDYLTKKFVLEIIPKIPIQNREILENRYVIEDIFAEGFAGYFFDSQADTFVADKKHFETVVNAHLQIMKAFRHRYGE